MKKYKVKKKVKHQDIGGKEFVAEFEVTPDEIDERAMKGNPACLNFAIRRDDFLPDFNKKCFYGHVEYLGYVLCEDELEEI